MALLLKNLLFTFVVPGTVGVYVPLAIASDRAPATGIMLVAAVLVLVLGASIYSWCVWDFATFGRGTPAPIDAPVKLVVRGLYRFIRNPMYVGVLTVILGWSILFRAWPIAIYALVVGTCFHLFTTLYEEPYLRGEFGDQYDAYCSRVGRWIPRL